MTVEWITLAVLVKSAYRLRFSCFEAFFQTKLVNKKHSSTEFVREKARNWKDEICVLRSKAGLTLIFWPQRFLFKTCEALEIENSKLSGCCCKCTLVFIFCVFVLTTRVWLASAALFTTKQSDQPYRNYLISFRFSIYRLKDIRHRETNLWKNLHAWLLLRLNTKETRMVIKSWGMDFTTKIGGFFRSIINPEAEQSNAIEANK